MSRRLLKTGLIGTAVTALCCFTPALVVLLGVLGLGTAAGYLDYVLLPVLAVFLGLTIYALAQKRCGNCTDSPVSGNDRKGER